MSGVLVPDDEAMIDDTPQYSASDLGSAAQRPEVLAWHMQAIGVLVALIAITFGLLLLAWQRFWPVLRRVHGASSSIDMPESPTTRGLRERLDRKKKR
jgi:hypothetical protein